MGESEMNLDFIKLVQWLLLLLFDMRCNLDFETVMGTLLAAVPS